jgi:hypothetical protein
MAAQNNVSCHTACLPSIWKFRNTAQQLPISEYWCDRPKNTVPSASAHDLFKAQAWWKVEEDSNIRQRFSDEQNEKKKEK